MAFNCGPRYGIEDPVPPSYRCLVVQSVGETDPRLKILEVSIYRAACLVIGEFHLSDQIGITGNLAGQRRGRCRIEPAIAVVPFRSWQVEVIAQSEIDGQPPRDLPIVLCVKPQVL